MCSCGSKRPKILCCFASLRDERAHPSIITPPVPETKYQHKSCYMRSTKDCSQKISREHYMSASVLRLIDEMIDVSGLPWITPGESRAIGIQALAAKVLCERHNNALSPLDKEGERFFQTFLDFSRIAYSEESCLRVFNGVDIERWMLKSLFGLLASESLQVAHGVPLHAEITPQCISLLNGTVAHANQRGMFVRAEPGHTLTTERSVTVFPVTNNQKQNLQGLGVNILGFDFLCSTCPINVDEAVYRPSYLVFKTSKDYRIIHFVWPEPESNAVLEWVAG